MKKKKMKSKIKTLKKKIKVLEKEIIIYEQGNTTWNEDFYQPDESWDESTTNPLNRSW